MTKKRQRYSLGLKEQVLQRMRLGEKIRALSRELKVPQSVLYEWRERAAERPGVREAECGEAEKRAVEARIAELERVIGRQTLELDFFASALRRIEGPRQNNANAGVRASGLKSAAESRRKAN